MLKHTSGICAFARAWSWRYTSSAQMKCSGENTNLVVGERLGRAKINPRTLSLRDQKKKQRCVVCVISLVSKPLSLLTSSKIRPRLRVTSRKPGCTCQQMILQNINPGSRDNIAQFYGTDPTIIGGVNSPWTATLSEIQQRSNWCVCLESSQLSEWTRQLFFHHGRNNHDRRSSLPPLLYSLCKRMWCSQRNEEASHKYPFDFVFFLLSRIAQVTGDHYLTTAMQLASKYFREAISLRGGGGPSAAVRLNTFKLWYVRPPS